MIFIEPVPAIVKPATVSRRGFLGLLGITAVTVDFGFALARQDVTVERVDLADLEAYIRQRYSEKMMEWLNEQMVFGSGASEPRILIPIECRDGTSFAGATT